MSFNVLYYIEDDAEESVYIIQTEQMLAEGKAEAVEYMDMMIADLEGKGLESAYVKELKYVEHIYELKSLIRGGDIGGARVYFFRDGERFFIVIGAEIKEGRALNEQLLADAVSYYNKYMEEVVDDEGN